MELKTLKDINLEDNPDGYVGENEDNCKIPIRNAAKEWIKELETLSPKKRLVLNGHELIFETNERIDFTINWIKMFFNLDLPSLSFTPDSGMNFPFPNKEISPKETIHFDPSINSETFKIASFKNKAEEKGYITSNWEYGEQKTRRGKWRD